jgi:hypothetical protein
MILALAVVAAFGCGGGTAAPPRRPHALGTQLAAQADAVEASLARGDACGAAGQADRLRQMVSEAVAAGQVPAALRRPLSGSVDSLAGEIACTPAPPAPPGPGKDKGKRPGHGNGKGHGHDHGDGGQD